MNNSWLATLGLVSLMSRCTPGSTDLGEGAGFSCEKSVISNQGGAAWMEPVDLDGDGYDEYLLTSLTEGIGFYFRRSHRVALMFFADKVVPRRMVLWVGGTTRRYCCDRL